MNSRYVDKMADDFVNDRDRQMKTLDVEAAKRSLQLQDHEDAFVLLILHKARYMCTHMPKELRHESGAWLRAGNHRQYGGDPILPERQSPE